MSGVIHSTLEMTESRQLICQRTAHVLFLLQRFVVTDVVVVSVVIVIVAVDAIAVVFLLLFLFTSFHTVLRERHTSTQLKVVLYNRIYATNIRNILLSILTLYN